MVNINLFVRSIATISDIKMVSPMHKVNARSTFSKKTEFIFIIIIIIKKKSKSILYVKNKMNQWIRIKNNTQIHIHFQLESINIS